MLNIKKTFLAFLLMLITTVAFSQNIRNGILTISYGTTVIKDFEYYGNQDIKKVIIPSSVKKIGKQAFHNCYNLTEIEIPNSVNDIGSNVFYGCDNLTSIRVDRYSFAHEFFSRHKALAFTSSRPAQTKEEWLANASIDIVDEGVLYIKPGTTKINGNAYLYASDFTKVVIPPTVTEIGAQAFCASKIEEVTIPGSVKHIKDSAFFYTPLEKAIIEEGVEQIDQYAFYTINKLYIYIPDSIKLLAPKNGITSPDAVWTVVQGSYAEEYVKGRCPYEIDYTKPYSAYSGKSTLSITIGKNVQNDYFKNCPKLERVDLGPEVTYILPGTISDKLTLRAKRNTYADTWAKSKGYYLCGVLADLNIYTKDRTKEIREDFTRILCDDDSYANWTSYSFNTHKPLKLEEVDGKLVLTSFMLQPCKNVTVTSQKGKSLIWNKTIQPLTRTILCDFDSLTDSIDNYSLTTNDAFYKTLSTIPTNWNISFNGFIRRVSTVKEDKQNTLKPVHAREWIALIYDMAYVFGLPEYEERCYEAVENKELVTDDELSVYLTKEEMANLLQKGRNYTLILGRCNDGYGLGSGNTLWLSSGWILGIGAGKSWYDTHAFWHEFSHCMGWGHHHGNMCNLERPAPWGTQCWPSIAAKLYVEELEKGNPPYIEGESFFNSKLFSKDDITPLPVEDDIVQNDTLYITEGMSYIDSHKNQKDFTKVHIPLSVEEIKPSALYGTNLTEITIPSYIRKIGAQAFKDCENLTKVTIEEGVKEIGNEAFLNSAITEIELPESVTVIGSNISSKNVLWVAKKGSLAYDYAVKNNYKIKFTQEELDEIASSILAEGKNAMAAPTDKWVTNTFTANETRCKWDFSDQLKGAGDYTISFSFTGGASMICIRDALVVADGKAIAYYQEKKTAGDNPKQILYSFTLPAGTKKLELYALARRSGNASSNGIVSIESLTDKSAKILKESASATAATETGWKANDFTTKYERRSWDFSMALEGAGEYKVTFTYTKGAHMLCLSEVIFTADGKAIACFPEERTAGTNPRRIVYNITLPKGCKKLEMFALARTSGGRDSYGSIEIKKTN